MALPAHSARIHYLPFRFAALGLAAVLPLGISLAGIQDKEVVTALQLQGDLMSYSDRFASKMVEALERYERSNPPVAEREFVVSDLTYSIASVFTLAAEVNPQSALLDMVVVTSLGRTIYEDDLSVQYAGLEPVVTAFQSLEAEVWNIAGGVLSAEEVEELRRLIEEWRIENPDDTVYNYVRFGDFAGMRRQSTLVQRRGGGLLGSVNAATQQAEEVRMLGERALFLATRLPLLTGLFAEAWTARVLRSPDSAQVLDDLHTLAALSERAVVIAEELPDTITDRQLAIVDDVMDQVRTTRDETVAQVVEQVRAERQAAIEQMLSGVAEERRNTIRALSDEVGQVTGLILELRSALEEGSRLVASTEQLSEELNLADAEFDFELYRDTLGEAAKAARETRALVETSGRILGSQNVEVLAPNMSAAVDRVEAEGEELVRYAFWRMVLLILIGAAVYVGASLLVHRLTAGKPAS